MFLRGRETKIRAYLFAAPYHSKGRENNLSGWRAVGGERCSDVFSFVSSARYGSPGASVHVLYHYALYRATGKSPYSTSTVYVELVYTEG